VNYNGHTKKWLSPNLKYCPGIHSEKLRGGIKKLRPVSVPAPKQKSQAREFGPTCSVTLINNTELSDSYDFD
jgi:hypothetical protein